MLKFEDINKKLIIDLLLIIINIIFISFLGFIIGYGMITNISFIHLFVVVGAYLQTNLLEKEIFKYWNDNYEVINIFNILFILNFILTMSLTSLFFNFSFIILLCLIFLINFVSILSFFKYYKGYVDCIIFQKKQQNEKHLGEKKND